jgi:hypothetical protein
VGQFYALISAPGGSVLRAHFQEIEYWHADMLTEHKRNHPRGSGWARVYDKLQAARDLILTTAKHRRVV